MLLFEDFNNNKELVVDIIVELYIDYEPGVEGNRLELSVIELYLHEDSSDDIVGGNVFKDNQKIGIVMLEYRSSS